jgi:N utilization substance protein B
MGVRRKSREAALQFLYQAEFDESAPRAGLARFWSARREERSVREYADQLVLGILEHRAELDGLIQSISRNWRVARMSLIDRNILRIAAFELRYEPGVAPAVVINEAIEVAKRYSGQEAAVFVNGILDGIRKSLAGLPPPHEDNHGSKEGQGTETEGRRRPARARTPGAGRRRNRKPD